jgi:hypothetical protein
MKTYNMNYGFHGYLDATLAGHFVTTYRPDTEYTYIVSGLNQPIDPVRAQLLIQKAQELCGEVKGLGNALLSAIEKREGEQISLLRQGHELKIQQLSQEVRFMQWKQAEEATESLLRTRASALER